MANLGAARRAWRAQGSAGAKARHDRGRGPDRSLRRRHSDRRHERHVFPGGTCGLIGPNGAGKTTFFNVLSGFVKPAAGSIARLRREPARARRLPARALGPAAHVPDGDGDRAALGLRQRRHDPRALAAPSEPRGGPMSLGAIEFVGLEASPKAKVGGLGARERRLVEVARAVVGKPRVVLLDEPAAGLPDEETVQLSEVIRRIPEHVRRARHPRRPRHEPRLRLLRDDRGARLRQADRVRPDGGGASQRARDARLPRHRGRSCERAGRRPVAPGFASTACRSRAADAPSCTTSRSRSRRAR